MGSLTLDRQRPSVSGGIPPRRPSRRGLAVAAATVAGVVVVAAVAAFQLLPSLGNPFTTQRVDRSQPALLRALEELSQYRAASAHFQVVLDVEEDARYIPAFVRGERTVFVAAGNVDGYVDFSQISRDAVKVSDDRRSVRVVLPRAQLAKPTVDPQRSYVAARDRGLVDRIGSVFSDSPTGERQFYLLAEEKLARAAREGGVVEATERNTRTMLEGMLRSLGFTDVTVAFRSGV